MGTEEHNLVLILARGLASSIATPILLVDTKGTAVYFNEPAEGILGRTYAEEGQMALDEWGTLFSPTEPGGNEPIDPGQLPLSIALQGRAAHKPMAITGGDGVRREIEVTAFPLYARTDEFVGAVAIFWEKDEV